ncbi:flagellar protein [Ammoniphilus sp. CFH 90114]|uniref:flagellar protein n=1 Tax=Ammoniphilus sp. CFH 90114 TaxID=2493665 RepID=UPI00100F11A5|nr:flagellar protein [Ammoniphilus sp. CFH 90114]RXT04122.1 flagellar protein [Ammoniphilus sp. CFH 90114]
MSLSNCPECGKLYVRTRIDMCPDCVKKIEEDIAKCTSYLKSNPKSTIQDVSEATGLSVKRITKFILKKRIVLEDYPNLDYPCDRCGTLIRNNRVCVDCYQNINSLVQTFKNKNRIIK